MSVKKIFIRTIPPVKIRQRIIYSVPESLSERVLPGSQVMINLSGKDIIAVVAEFSDCDPIIEPKVKDIRGVADLPIVKSSQIKFWEWMSEYYMCTEGELYKAAYSGTIKGISGRKSRKKEPKCETLSPLPHLSEAQREAVDNIKSALSSSKPVFLKGEPASGKSEIFLTLAGESLNRGESVLYLVPEITLCTQITQRAREYFGNRVVISHSAQSISERLSIIRRLSDGNEPLLVIGVRSAVLLPFENLGLVIVEEEHDASYKQYEPAPRYNARDAAIVLASLNGADAILGSSTPSFETILNVREGKYSEVILGERYHSSLRPEIRVARFNPYTSKEGKTISPLLESALKRAFEAGERSVIISAKRYMSVPDNELCTSVIAREISSILPDAKVARYDRDSDRITPEQIKVLEAFTSGEYDVLVSNKMTGKGFNFPGVILTALLFADNITMQNDFRSGERFLQAVYQIAGRAGREERRGVVIVQSSNLSDRLVRSVRYGEDVTQELISEREEFMYPPFSRMINIDIRAKTLTVAAEYASALKDALLKGGVQAEGPYDPGNITDKPQMRLSVKIQRGKNLREIKRFIGETCEEHFGKTKRATHIIDVDPV